MDRGRLLFTDTTAPDYALEQRMVEAAGLAADATFLKTRDPEAVLRAAERAEVIVLSWAPFARETLQRLPRLRALVRYGIGVDMIDVEAASELGILVCNPARYALEEVSTHTLALLLLVNRGLFPLIRHVASGGWSLPEQPQPRRLSGQTLGLIGLGNIGRKVAAKARGLGLSVVAYDPHLSRGADAEDVRLLDFREVLAASDYVSIHCPLTPATRHLIGAPELALMRADAYLINTARGGIIDQRALAAALRARRIAGAALDVTDPEPLPPDDPLRTLDNVFITPHRAHASLESVLECRRTAVEHALAVLGGDVPQDVVNRGVLARPPRIAGLV